MRKFESIFGSFFLVLILSLSSTLAQGVEESKEYNAIFFRANNSYREEKYEDAIQNYEKLFGSGIRSANIFYNLGNAYLKTGNKGKAILYYERAFRMRPRDADIRSNLSYAQTLVEGNAGQSIGKWYERVFLFFSGYLSTNELTFLASALYFLTLIFLALSVYFRPLHRLLYYFAAAFFIFLIIILPSFIGNVYRSEYQREAVVMVRDVDVRFEPKDDATLHFKLYEGAVIRIDKSQEGWHKISRNDGKMGWLKGDVFAII